MIQLYDKIILSEESVALLEEVFDAKTDQLLDEKYRIIGSGRLYDSGRKRISLINEKLDELGGLRSSLLAGSFAIPEDDESES